MKLGHSLMFSLLMAWGSAAANDQAEQNRPVATVLSLQFSQERFDGAAVDAVGVLGSRFGAYYLCPDHGSAEEGVLEMCVLLNLSAAGKSVLGSSLIGQYVLVSGTFLGSSENHGYIGELGPEPSVVRYSMVRDVGAGEDRIEPKKLPCGIESVCREHERLSGKSHDEISQEFVRANSRRRANMLAYGFEQVSAPLYYLLELLLEQPDRDQREVAERLLQISKNEELLRCARRIRLGSASENMDECVD